MPDHKYTYQKQAVTYEALVSREDFQGNILNTLKEICDLDELDVLDAGCGTGRLACLLAPLVHSMRAFDSSLAMVKIAEQKLTTTNQTNCRCGAADHRALPVPASSADLIISGWSVCYLATWGNETWQSDVIKAILEFKRILKPGGRIILLESLGTGETAPNPPKKLIPYLRFLEKLGFSRCWIRTDYQFKSIAERDKLISFFFGEEMIQTALPENPLIIPECTGVWKLKVL